jgi:hypothetical protein
MEMGLPKRVKYNRTSMRNSKWVGVKIQMNIFYAKEEFEFY